MSALLDHLRRRIAAEGPIGVDAYMAEALSHPELGYYMSRDPLGRAGDFITAPEISQMFGEMIGLWSAAVWRALGRPPLLRLVELGPGRGTLMADALRAAASVEGFLAGIRVHLVESSQALAKRQRDNLSMVTPPVVWHERFAEVPDGPMMVIANEFLDALPIRQFLRTRAGWSERRIDFWDDGLVWVDAPTIPPTSIEAPVGAIIELSPVREALVREVAGQIVRSGGAALFIDYGHLQSAPGDTLQAVKDHHFHDVLADPGDADLTSHVDFERLGDAARATGAAVHGPVTQGAFLRELGIEMRAHMLAQGASLSDAGDVRAALRRLTHPDEMGELFKVLAITAPGALRPEGFGG